MMDELITIELDTWADDDTFPGINTALWYQRELALQGHSILAEDTGERTSWPRWGQTGTWVRFSGSPEAIATIIDLMWCLEEDVTADLIERARGGELRPVPAGGWPA